MIRKTLVSLLFLFVCITLVAFAGGDGSQSTPYQVSTLAELQDVANHLDSNFIQIADIDASETSGWNGGAGFDPIGSPSVPFTGRYNGQGYEISNLFIDRTSSSNIGLFGGTSDAELWNIILVDGEVMGNDRTGGIVGAMLNSTIRDCFSSGVVSGDFSVGGIGGRITGGFAIGCYSIATTSCVLTGERTGGLFGHALTAASITNCYSRGAVNGDNKVGGLVGELDHASIDRCYSTGQVTCLGDDRGGLVGSVGDSCAVTLSYWDTETSGQDSSPVGTGKTSEEMKYFYMYHGAGWDFVAETQRGTNNYWDIDTSGAENDGYPCLAWENGYDNYLQAPAGSGTNASPYQITTLFDLFWISANSNQWNKNYLQIADIDASDTRNWNSGAGFKPIGASPSNYFGGVYDGGGFVIDGLYSYRYQDLEGMFGFCYQAAFRNLNLTNAEIDGTHDTGTIAATLRYSTMENCHSSGIVTSTYYAGGLIGYGNHASIISCSSSADASGVFESGGLIDNTSACVISRCWATGSVNGNSSGGLVGALGSSTIDNCFSSGQVSGDRAGGFVGETYGGASSIEYCYSTGAVTGSSPKGFLSSGQCGITSCFWDTETSGQSTSNGGTGHTTAEMQTLSTYIDAGWDMAGEGINGTEDIWVIFPGEYPSFTSGLEPVITAAVDIPADQGHKLQLVWDRAALDTSYSPSNFYTVWQLVGSPRAIAPGAVVIESPADFSSHVADDTHPVILHDRDSYWAWLATIPAMIYPQYAYFAATLVDSSEALAPEDYTSTYHVCYHYDVSYLTSNEMSGYSVDNIAPYAARGVRLAFDEGRTSSATLRWDEITEGGFGGNSYPEQNGVWYRVYAGDLPDFVCDEAHLLETTQNTSYEITSMDSGRKFFKIVVSDQP